LILCRSRFLACHDDDDDADVPTAKTAVGFFGGAKIE
jgi:hypothetical protein